MLVVHAINQKNSGLSHPFSQHHIKRRIMMSHHIQSFRHKARLFSAGNGIAPVCLVLFSRLSR